MFTSGIALRGHQALTVTSQPFGVSWTPFSCEDVVDPAHCCLKSLSAWNAALTTGLGSSSLIPDTISHWFGRINLQLVLEVSYKYIRGDNQGRPVMGQVLAILSLFQQQEEETKTTLQPPSLPVQWPTSSQTPSWKPVTFSSASLQT